MDECVCQRCSPSALARPDQQNKSKSEPSRLQQQIAGQDAARQHVTSVLKVVDEPMAVTPLLLNGRRMLQVVNLIITGLPILPRPVTSHQTKLNWRGHELKALDLDRFSKMFS